MVVVPDKPQHPASTWDKSKLAELELELEWAWAQEQEQEQGHK